VNQRRLQLVTAFLLVACLLVVGAGAVVGPAWQVRDHLLAAARLSHQLHLQLERGELAAARETLTALRRQTRAARDATTGPGWWLGSRLPGLGRNLAATGEVAVVIDELTRDGLAPMVELAGELSPGALAPRAGRVELAPLRRAAGPMAAVDRAVRRARDRVAAIPADSLLPPLRSAVIELRRQLDRAARDTGTAARAARLLPPMLGAAGPRTYLVLFQNPAEIRATGGMPGAFAVVRADQGAVRIIEQGTASADLRSYPRPVLPLAPELRDLYTDRLGRYPADVNLTPHFPTAAELAREMYRRQSGRTVDGVLATDPVALSYLLRATGPVPVAGGGRLPGGGRLSGARPLPGSAALSADNAVRVLLSDVYAGDAPAAVQDEYFAAAAAATFDALVAGGADPRTALAQLDRAAGERRVLLWSAHPAEQRLLAGTVLAGILPAADGQRPTVGVFLNDGSGAKLGYYLTQAAELRAGQCRTDGRRELRLRVTLGSTAPERGLSGSVLGLGLAGDPYTIRTNLTIVAPAGGSLVGVRRDGEPVPVGTGVERERAVGILTVELPPGGRVAVEATLLTGRLALDRPVSPGLRVTPTVTPWEKKVHSALVCRG
jgi:hypothetical protein